MSDDDALWCVGLIGQLRGQGYDDEHLVRYLTHARSDADESCSPGGVDWTVYWFMFPVCIAVASIAMFSGISGAAAKKLIWVALPLGAIGAIVPTTRRSRRYAWDMAR